jgi:LuxR family maltose regulon positive regulatory protein
MPTMPSRPSSGAVTVRPDAAMPPPAAGDSAPAEASAGRRRAPSATRRPRIVVKGALDMPVPARPEAVLPLEYPIQPGKVHAPALRDDTLARDRLLDWLSVKIHSRVVLLIAEAGYGKTTLLADFSRRTRVRVLWYRLDRGDRDWVGFIAHLVAAVRVHVPAFGSATAGLLRETATSMPSLETVLDTFLRELSGLPNDSTALVFDDVHLVDDAPDVRQILRELLARGPERMSFVFASRREPPVRLARLRALGEVAELLTDDLRFDSAETERLFRETYALTLEPAVLAELSHRTEGWAASLQLVRAAIHDRNPAQVRAFISSLSGAEGHLYEYLAEEVIGDLPKDLQNFLMRTSVLETIDLRLGPVAAGVDEGQARAFVEQAEIHGLVSRRVPGSRGSARAHPLVRDFLLARLERTATHLGVQAIHLAVARAAQSIDWQISARHFVSAGDAAIARQVLEGSLERILSTGAFEAAMDIARLVGADRVPNAAELVIESRNAQQRMEIREGLALAERAWAVDPSSSAVLVNLASARMVAGDVAGAIEAARQLGQMGPPALAALGRSLDTALQTTLGGSLEAAERELTQLAETFTREGSHHYRGVSLQNLGWVRLARGQFEVALATADEAIVSLEMTSAGMELASARALRAAALYYLGQVDRARAEVADLLRGVAPGQVLEIAGDIGEAEALSGEPTKAWPLLERVGDQIDEGDRGEEARLSRALNYLQIGNVLAARQDISFFRHGRPSSSAAFEAKRHIVEGLLVAIEGGGRSAALSEGTSLAASQGAVFWQRLGELIGELADELSDPSAAIAQAASELPVVLSASAVLVVPRLAVLDSDALAAVAAESERRPWRWREPLREAVANARGRHLELAAELLEQIGETRDIRGLNRASKQVRERQGPRLGYKLARRLAPRVFVEDLGRVSVVVGERTIDGSEVRRKVLALLCLLLSRPRFASTRDEVVDSLWPDHDPASALNSLNQTVYFLRRVFEPDFREELSPGYVGQDGETIWLDYELIDSRSRRCLELIRSMPGDPSPEGSVGLAEAYRARFALDFAYEEWSGPYRDSLHAGYLRVVERAVRMDLDSGHLGRGTFIAERAAEIDPDSEEIQVALVRLYRHSGAHAAAAEQYAHYSQVLRDLGVDPPAFADV